MATMRIAKITYDHHQLAFSEKGKESVGQQIDKFISETLKQGHMVSEVSLFFEGEEEQHKLAQAYAYENEWAEAVAVDNYKPKKPLR